MWKTSRGILVVAVAITLLVSVNSAAAQQGDVREEIEAAYRKFNEALGRGDATALAAFYTAEAMLLLNGRDIINGREAIKNFWQDSVNNRGIKGVKLTVVEVESFGDTAYDVAKYEMIGENGKILDNGKSVVIWKQVNGQWRLHRDIPNTSVPASAR